MPVRRRVSLDEETASRLREFQELTGTTRDEAVDLLLRMVLGIRSAAGGKQGGGGKGGRGKRGKKTKRVKMSVNLADDLAELGLGSADLSAARAAVAPVVGWVSPGARAGEVASAVAREVDSLIARLISFRGLLREVGAGGGSLGPEEEAILIRELLYMLARELGEIKGRPEFVSAYRRVVPPEDVGYVTTLMSALYSDDRLKRWILTTDYGGVREGGGGGGGEEVS